MLTQNEVDGLWGKVDFEDDNPDFEGYWKAIEERGGQICTHSANISGYCDLIDDLIAAIEKLGGSVLNDPEWEDSSEMSVIIVLPERTKDA